MSENGIALYDLAPELCPECRSPVGNRVLMTDPTGCATCDEAITRHRCLGRPSRGSLPTGGSWECPDCGSRWTAVLQRASCSECGQATWRETWDAVEGDRMATAPRYHQTALTPMRNALRRPASKCHQTEAGVMVHVKPDCRCR